MGVMGTGDALTGTGGLGGMTRGTLTGTGTRGMGEPCGGTGDWGGAGMGDVLTRTGETGEPGGRDGYSERRGDEGCADWDGGRGDRGCADGDGGHVGTREPCGQDGGWGEGAETGDALTGAETRGTGGD